MSTKIYNAFRVKEGIDLWELVHDWQKKGYSRVKEIIIEVHQSLIKNVKVDSPEYLEVYKRYREWYPKITDEQVEEIAKSRFAAQTIEQEYKKQVTSGERNPFNFDVSITFRGHKGRLYVQCFCDWTMRYALDFVEKDQRVEDYHFQNSTDKSANCSDEEWKEREKIWDEIYGYNGNPYDHSARLRYLALEIMTHREFGYLMYDIELKWERNLERRGI